MDVDWWDDSTDSTDAAQVVICCLLLPVMGLTSSLVARQSGNHFSSQVPNVIWLNCEIIAGGGAARVLHLYKY